MSLKGLGDMSIERLALLCAAIVAASSTAAWAEDTGKSLYLSPDETRQCVCMEDRINELQSGRQPIDELEAEYKRVDELVTKARGNVNVEDQDEVDSFRRMFNRREALRLQLQAEKGRSELHGLIGSYNGLCAGKRMFKINVDAVRADANACLQQ